MARVAYNNADYPLRVMAHEYFDLDQEQTDLTKSQLARFHAWHRSDELPLYANIFESGAERVARGLTRDDVTWAMGAIRERYLVFVTQGAEEGAPVVAMFKPDNVVALERKFDELNTKYAKEFLSGGQSKRERARAKALEERFEAFMGDLTDAQQDLIRRFVQAQPDINQARYDDRKRRQQELLDLLAQYRASPQLSERLRDYFVSWERNRSPGHTQLAREWEERLVTLVVDIDATMTPEQRARTVRKLESYAEDCRVLAQQGRSNQEIRADVAPDSVLR